MRIGVIGCGDWGKNLVRTFHKLGVLHGICDTSWERLEPVTKEYPGVPNYGSVEFLLNSDIDAVAIATPASTHFEVAHTALIACKDVFVEKPLAFSCSEGQELVNLAKERKKILMVGHILAYHPAVVKLKEMIVAGELGKINYIYSNRLNLGRLRTEENVLLSFAPHDISAILDIVGEEPFKVSVHEGTYISEGVSDVSIMVMDFPGGVKSHIFVSWLHPYKEQKLIVVGTKAMAVFDDMSREKLFIYPHKIKWEEGKIPVAEKALYELVPGLQKLLEPLKMECEHFIDCVKTRTRPRTDGESALKVLRVLDACRRDDQLIHESSFIDESAEIGEGTKIWHFCHISDGAKIGKNCTLGQNVFIGRNVKIADNVKLQNNVSVYEGVELESDVFIGPSVVFTNVLNPRSVISRKNEFKKTLVKHGVTIGANATVICGVTIKENAFIGAGAVVTKDVPSYSLAYGVPAKVEGTVNRKGEKVE